MDIQWAFLGKAYMKSVFDYSQVHMPAKIHIKVAKIAMIELNLDCSYFLFPLGITCVTH